MSHEYWEIDYTRPPEPLYRVIWGRGPTSTLPMLWPGVLRFVRIVRKARPGLPIEVVRVERVAPNA